MRKRVWLLTAAAFVAFFSQVPGLSSQETTSQPASLEGIVVNARTGERLSGVGVFAPPPPGVLPPTTSPPDVATDGSGSFLLERLLPERSSVAFRKPGYVPRAITYSLAAGRRTAGVVVRLNPTGVLSGRVFDATGKPAAAIVVTAFGLIYTSGYSELKNRGEAISNDRGEFRLTELLPDRYTLSFQSQAAQRFGLQVSTREPALLYPGVESFSKAESVEVVGGSETRLKDVTFSSTASLGEVRIHLNVGAGEGSRDVLLWFQKATRSERIVDGRLIGSTPVRPAASERFCGDDTPPPCRSSQEIMKVRVNPGADIDRSWWPTAPGTYEAGVQWTSSDGLARQVFETFDFRGGDTTISLTLAPPDGQIELRAVQEEADGTSRLLTENAGIALCRSKSGCLGPLQGWSLNLAKGIGKLGGLVPGRYYVISATGPADTYIASARQGSADALVEGVIVSKDAAPLEIRVKPGKPSLSGNVVDTEGRPVTDAVVGILPDSPLDATQLRSLRRTVRTSHDGQFALTGILPGSYRVYAWSSLTENIFADPTFVTTFKERGTRVMVGTSVPTPVSLIPLE